MQEHLHSWAEIPTRAECWLWTWWLLVPFIVGNTLTATAYLRIPWQLLKVVAGRKGKWLNKETGWAAAFIVMCGVGHFLSVLLVWFRLYPLAVSWDFATGLVSWRFSFLLETKLRAIIAAPDFRELMRLKDFWETRDKELEAHPLVVRPTDKAVREEIARTIQFLDRALVAEAAAK